MRMPTSETVFVAGHKGMVGSAILRKLEALGYEKLLTAGRKELDLLNPDAVKAFFSKHKIDQVYLAAAKVGGIHANNTFPADFIYENLMIQANVINAAHLSNVQKLMFLGSSCIYPKYAEQPIKEEALMTGTLEPTNEPYAVAKIAGIKLCESYNRQHGRDYRCVMPTNLYGPNDNFHPENSHVIPALIHRFHEAIQQGKEEIEIWGSGNALREFMHVDDMASGSIYIMEVASEKYNIQNKTMLSHINIGAEIDYSIKELAEKIATVVGFEGGLIFDRSKPDGTPRKIMDASRMKKLGFSSKISLDEGLKDTYAWYLANIQHVRN